MIKESGRMVKKSGERILGVFESLGDVGSYAPGVLLRDTVGRTNTTEVGAAIPALAWAPNDSPLAHVGPIPEELRKDPFPGGSVPWCIQEAEKERNRKRELMIWKVAITVSWMVAAVAALRSVGML